MRESAYTVASMLAAPPYSSLLGSYLPDMHAAGEERQQMAGRCLGELVRKMGERVLTHIIPILQKGMSSEDAATRQAMLPACCKVALSGGTPTTFNPPCQCSAFPERPAS